MAIVNRTLGRKPDADHMLPNMITWEDNLDESKWYYTDVQEATNSHDFEVESDADGLYEVWTGLLQVRDWAALEPGSGLRAIPLPTPAMWCPTW